MEERNRFIIGKSAAITWGISMFAILAIIAKFTFDTPLFAICAIFFFVNTIAILGIGFAFKEKNKGNNQGSK